MSVFTVVWLIYSRHHTFYVAMLPIHLTAAAAQALKRSDNNGFRVGDVGMASAAVLAPGRRPFTAGKPAKTVDIYHFHFSFGNLSERFSEGSKSAARHHPDGKAAAVWWIFPRRRVCTPRCRGERALGGVWRPCTSTWPAPMRRLWAGLFISSCSSAELLQVNIAVRDQIEV